MSRILSADNGNVDSIELVSLPPEFGAGDTIMLYCVQGAAISLDGFGQEQDIGRDAQDPRNTGKYSIFIVNEIVDGDILVLNTVIGGVGEINPLGPGEVAQVIKVRSYYSAEVTPAGLTAPAWNGTTGGVVALFVTTVLELNGDIDVSGKGFRGAEPTEVYDGTCTVSDLDLYDSTFYQSSNVKAGKKGEGTTDTRFQRLRGKAKNINGGGGGNGNMSGGGGGSNYRAGGRGGIENSACPPGVIDPQGRGGDDFGRFGSIYYVNGISPAGGHNRIFFGGGGGTGTEIAGRTTSDGGDGGGIVLIVADTITGNGHRIRAEGKSVSTAVNGAGGGGGGGGAIVLDVAGYKEGVNLSAMGGDGGSTNHASEITGPGGGGGGGIYWLAGPNVPGVQIENDLSSAGQHIPTADSRGATAGNAPARKNGLIAPLKGFIFNSVPSEFHVCSNQVPAPIFASLPKGGSGNPANYQYQWLDSSATQNQWLPVDDQGDATAQSLLFTSPLSDTTYYRRVVTDLPSLLPADTSLRVAVYVHQAIENNVISADDEVCEGFAPDPFISVGSPTKGDGEYAYRWVRHAGDGLWANAPGSNSQAGYASPALDNPTGTTLTMSFARIVTSGACVDTTLGGGIIDVTVFKSITGNTLDPAADTICWNTRPAVLAGAEIIGGGKPSDYRYRWEDSGSESGPWSTVSGETQASYRPGRLQSTTWYRRVVLSGDGNACEDNSPPVQILNIPVVTDNSITGAEQTICTGDQPALETGSDPRGGDGTLYRYAWEQSTDQNSWIAADATNGNTGRDYQAPPMPGDTTWYRRIVSSGGSAGVCRDTSLSKVIHVLPALENFRAVGTDVEVNCQFDRLADLKQIGSPPAGGAMQPDGTDPTRNFKWEMSNQGGSGPWSGVTNGYGPDLMNYTDSMELDSPQDYWFRRVLFSGPVVSGQLQACADTSDIIHVVIHTAIGNNLIDDADSVCYGAPKDFPGSVPTGEEEEPVTVTYSWKELGGGTVLGTDPDLQNASFTTPAAQQLVREVQFGECESVSDTLELTVMELPGGTLSGSLSEACEVDVTLDVDLDIEGLSRYNLPWEVQLYDGLDSTHAVQELEGDGTVDLTLHTESSSTAYAYSLARIAYFTSDGTECLAPVENLDGIVPIEVYLTPDPTVSIEDNLVVGDTAICNNEILLSVDPDGGTGRWESNHPDEMTYNPASESLLVWARLDPEDSIAWTKIPYQIWFTSNIGVCQGRDTVSIYLYEQPEDANAGLDDTIFLTNSTYLNADPPTAGEGTWTVISGQGTFEDENSHNTYVYDLAKGERNEFRWTIVNGVCESSDDFSVITQAEVSKYEGISPNGDGYNDYFIIRGLDNPRARFTLSIFNSLGRPVRIINQENVGEISYDPGAMVGGVEEGVEKVVWDGLAENGTPVPAGTYYYLLEVEIDQVDDRGTILSTDKKSYKHFIVVRD